MSAFLIFIVLPVVLIVLSFRIRPLVEKDRRTGDSMGAGQSARGMFGDHGLEPDPITIPAETEAVKFDLRAVKPRG